MFLNSHLLEYFLLCIIHLSKLSFPLAKAQKTMKLICIIIVKYTKIKTIQVFDISKSKKSTSNFMCKNKYFFWGSKYSPPKNIDLREYNLSMFLTLSMLTLLIFFFMNVIEGHKRSHFYLRIQFYLKIHFLFPI